MYPWLGGRESGLAEKCEIDRACNGELREGLEHLWYYMSALEGEHREKW